MQSLNRVMLIGNLGNKPERFTSQTGKVYCRLSIATHRRWQEETGVWKEKTDWHYVVAWGQQAERCIRSLEKGSLVFVEGMISSFDNTKREPIARMTTITAETVQFLKIPDVRKESIVLNPEATVTAH